MTPPYDIISPSASQRYYEVHPYNIIRVVLGKTYPNDNALNNCYTRAKEYFADLVSKEVLIQDEKPNLYLYEQEFKIGRKKFRRLGLICRVKIEEYSNRVILPHEATLKKPKEDRFNLIKSTGLNICPVFGLYEDSDKKISRYFKKITLCEPFVKFTDEYQITHTLWKISFSTEIEEIGQMFGEKKVLLADGHHRYEVALKYKKYLEDSGLQKEDLNYTLFCLTSMEDPGLVILPIHRLLKNGADFQNFAGKVSDNFDLERVLLAGNLRKTASEIEKILIEKGGPSPSFGVFIKGGDEIWLISLKGEKNKFKSQLESLDVSILHNLVFKQALGLTLENEDNIKYTKESLKVLEEVQKGLWEAGFILNPALISQIKEVAFSGTLMPQKSTYFFPKVLSGLTINKIL